MAKKATLKKIPAKKTAKPAPRTEAKKAGAQPPRKPSPKGGEDLTKKAVSRPTKAPAAKPATVKPLAPKPSAPKPPAGKPSAAKPPTAVVGKPKEVPPEKVSVEPEPPPSPPTAEEVAKPEVTWVVWEDGRGIWLGTVEDYKRSKRPETTVCDVFNSGADRDFRALDRAVQLGHTKRRDYATAVRPWLQYDDSSQQNRVREWEQRLAILVSRSAQ
jgi:hypothetical protein